MKQQVVAGVVLASGLSRRFGGRNKLLADIDGRPMVHRTVSAYVDAGLSPVVVVVGHDAGDVAAALGDLPVDLIHNPDFAQGQSRALVRGVGAIDGKVDAAVIGVADQPWLNSETIRLLTRAWEETRAPIVVPVYGGQRGNPVLFSGELFSELLEVTGDTGGRPVLQRHRERAVWVEIADTDQGRDVDEPQSLPGD